MTSQNREAGRRIHISVKKHETGARKCERKALVGDASFSAIQ
jgi:hypothetical protein